MNLFISISIAITLVVSFIPIILIVYKKGQHKKLHKSLLSTIISFNSIWYAVLLIEYAQSNLTFNLNTETAVNVFSVTLMFLIRFIYLFYFMKLFQLLLDFKPTKGLRNALVISGVVVVGIWILGLLEFFVLSSHVLTSNLLLYTDILIFFIIIISSIYLIYQTNSIYEHKIQKPIKFLVFIFLIPMSLGFLKWLAGNILDENTLREKLSIPLLVLLMNVMMLVWLVFYGKKVDGFKVLANSKIDNNNKDLIQKYGISKREMEVINLICEGCSNKEIADRLFISVETVKDHNSRIYLKTEVKNRTQLAKLFLEKV